ncbi:MAG: tetratricopeptide repeat protein [Terriglobia bacterium]
MAKNYRATTGLFLVVIMAAPALRAQQAPLLPLTPRAERIYRLELYGDVRMARKRYRDAAEFYQEAFQLNSKKASLANKVGIAYFQQQDYNRARSWYDRALKINRRFFEPLNNLGMVYYVRRNYKKARRYFQRALRLRPESASAHVNLAASYLSLKKPDEAFHEYRLALLLNPEILRQSRGPGVVLQTQSLEDMAQFHFVLARTFAALGDVERCLAYLRRALEEGFRDLDQLNSEPNFVFMREDIRFQQLLAQPPQAIKP